MRKELTSIIIGISLLSVLLALFIVISDSSVSDTAIGEGHITTDTIWNLSGSPYFIEGNVTVDYGVSLTIEAGVEVYFNGYHCLYIEGNLSAQGNISNMIKFTSNKTSPSTGDWDRIQINETGHGTLRFCNITYANFGISLSGSLGSDIQSNHLSNNLDAIHLYESSNNTILNTNISNNLNNGMFLGRSSGNFIQSNNISDNFWHGVHIYDDSTENDMLSNRLEGNFRGFFLRYSNSNTIRYNYISSNFGDGLQMRDSSDNEIRNNNISNNGGFGEYYGINLNLSNNNRIFHNTFIDNANQAFDDSNDSNQWDDGYPRGGNFWNDYTGEDVNRGENQDVPGPDGIGDIRYMIDLVSTDHFPLMKPSRDIAPYLIALNSPQNESIIKQSTIIDLDILAEDYDLVNYSVNGGINSSLSSPFNISAATWGDGGNRLDVYVTDTSGNVSSRWYIFTMDSKEPQIILNSPGNRSFIKAGGIINISISEPNIKSAEYNVNGNLYVLLFPYDIDTSSWQDGHYSIEIHAEDLPGNMNSTLFEFTIDSTPPVITMNFPANNSYIKPGMVINISVEDEHLDTSSGNYSVNGEDPQTFAIPYNITTTNWGDGSYIIEVKAADILGNARTRFFNITIDSIPPSIILNEPRNTSVITSGTPLNFSVFDTNPIIFNYSVDTGFSLTLPPPYSIDTSTWSEGNHTVYVDATDQAGNFNQSWYIVSIDSSPPFITPIQPSNNSIIQSGIVIFFAIHDLNLAFVNYTVNDGESQSLIPSLGIETTDWSEGAYIIEVHAVDSVGNHKTASFTFNIDNSPPRVILTSPNNRANDVSTDATITIKFSEVMNKGSVRYAIMINPSIGFNLSWSPDDLSLKIDPIGNLINTTIYTIVINTSARDLGNNALTEDFILTFNTGSGQEEDWTWLILMAAMAFIIGLTFLAYLISRRGKGSEDIPEAGEDNEFDIAEKEPLENDELEDGLLGDEPRGELGEGREIDDEEIKEKGKDVLDGVKTEENGIIK